MVTKAVALFMVVCLSYNICKATDGVTESTKAKSVGVFCSANDQIPASFKKAAFSLGKAVAKNHYNLITGGSKTGLMKEVVDGYLNSVNAKQLHGVMPEALRSYNVQHTEILDDNLTWTETLHKRLAVFQDKVDIIVVMPGGFGTLHELMDFLTHSQFGLIKKQIILLNLDHFWDHLLEQFKVMLDTNTVQQKHLNQMQVVTTVDEVIQTIEHNLKSKNTLDDENQGLKGRYWEQAK